MKFYRKAESAATRILEAFKTGNLPRALAPVFVNRKDNVPCRSWSWSNQLLTALSGYSAGRGPCHGGRRPVPVGCWLSHYSDDRGAIRGHPRGVLHGQHSTDTPHCGYSPRRWAIVGGKKALENRGCS